LIKKRKVERENRNLLVDIKNKTFQMTEVMMDGNVSKSQDFSKNTNNTNKFKNKLKLPQFNDRKIVVEVNIWIKFLGRENISHSKVARNQKQRRKHRRHWNS